MVGLGICSCGGFVEKAVLPMIQQVDNVEAVAAFTRNQDWLHALCAAFDIQSACATFDDLLALPEVDAVYIASPNALHREQVLAAARAGKHVLCEKPLGMNAAECREMVEVCRNAGVKLGVGFCYRFGGAQQTAKKMVEEGAIGDVSYIYLSFNLFGYNPDTAGWRCDPKLSGGGPLMDVAPHMVDLASFFLEDRVRSVAAWVEPEMTDTQVETDVLAIMQFERGARASMDVSFAVRGNTQNYTIVGSGGEIHAAGTISWLTSGKKVGRLTLEKNWEAPVEVDFPAHEHIAEQLRLFCRAIERDEAVPVPGEAGLEAQAVIDAVYEAGRTGTTQAVC